MSVLTANANTCVPLCLQKYRYQDDETPPVDPSPGHMTHGRSTDLSHAHLDGYTHPAALTVRKQTHSQTHTESMAVGSRPPEISTVVSTMVVLRAFQQLEQTYVGM